MLEFPRALRRTLLELGIPQDLADQLVDPGREEDKGDKGGVKGKKGKKGKGKGKGKGK